jgi:hypothetical protein
MLGLYRLCKENKQMSIFRTLQFLKVQSRPVVKMRRQWTILRVGKAQHIDLKSQSLSMRRQNLFIVNRFNHESLNIYK